MVGSRIQLKKTGKNYSALCPFHKEKTPSFSVSPDKQFYYCFGCGAGGNALGFVMDHDQLDFPRRSKSWQSAPAWKSHARTAGASTSPASRSIHRSTHCSPPPPTITARR